MTHILFPELNAVLAVLTIYLDLRCGIVAAFCAFSLLKTATEYYLLLFHHLLIFQRIGLISDADDFI